MIDKHPIRPQRLRQVPSGFSWVDNSQLAAARSQLVQADLIAYQKPLYQVLALPEEDHGATAPAAPRTGQLRSIGDILRRALEGGAA